MTDGKKYTFRVAYMYPDHDSHKINCITFDKATNGLMYLLNSGEIKYGTPSDVERKNIVTYVITQRDKWDKKDAQGKPTNGISKLYGDFSYYSEEIEDRMSESEKKANMLMRKFHGFIKTHECFRIVDKKTGNNINKNLTMALFELEDIGAETLQKAETNKKITHLSDLLTNMVEDLNNPSKIIDLSFALGVVNVHTKTKEDLYNICMDIVKINPDRVQDMVDNQKQWLYAMVEKGIALPIGESTKTVIDMEDGYYTLNGTVLGKTTEELVKYFEINESALTLLEQKLGTFRDKVVLPRNLKEQPITIDNQSILEDADKKKYYEEKKKEIKTKIYQSVSAVSKKSKTKETHKVFIDKLKEEYSADYTSSIIEFNEMYLEQFKVK